ncbi:hypothetical protein PG991_003313 [Apiospora marii]|uniref:CCD97-like C-terminal domain-containing protein n=1 Tax=Apiospora marii TaxID=335849 RepID=A0ABR1SHV0_9PEZI
MPISLDHQQKQREAQDEKARGLQRAEFRHEWDMKTGLIMEVSYPDSESACESDDKYDDLLEDGYDFFPEDGHDHLFDSEDYNLLNNEYEDLFDDEYDDLFNDYDDVRDAQPAEVRRQDYQDQLFSSDHLESEQHMQQLSHTVRPGRVDTRWGEQTSTPTNQSV